MKKRLYSLILAFVLTLGCLSGSTVNANLEGWSEFSDLHADYYIVPEANVNEAAVIRGGSRTLTFRPLNLSNNRADYYCVSIYRGSIEQIDNQLSQGKELEEMDSFYVSAQELWNTWKMTVNWKADSRYTVGTYSLVCYRLDAETNTIYDDRNLFWTELYVVNEKRPANNFSVWVIKDDGWYEIAEDSILTTPYQNLFLAIMPEPYPCTDSITWSVKSSNAEMLMPERVQNAFGYCYFDVGGQGIARITVTVGKNTLGFWLKSGTFDEATALELHREKTSLCVGEQDTCEVRPKNNDEICPGGAIWTSSDPGVATVDSQGKVTAVAPGKVLITAVAARFTETVEYTVHYHELPENTPVTGPTATQPKQAVGHCSVCGKDDAVNIYEPAIFTDTKASAWYAKHVDKVYDLGLMNGVGEHTFAPNANVTRAMAATVLYRIAGKPKVEGAGTFTDVAPGKYYSKAVVWAQETGVVNGYPDGTFRPDENITREQLAAILCRYAKATGCDVSAATDLGSFPDGDKVHNYAKKALAWAVGEKLITGVGVDGKTFLQPTSNATRAQFATIISRYLAAVTPADGPEEPDPDTPDPTPTDPDMPTQADPDPPAGAK